MNASKSKQRVPYRRTVDVSDIVVSGDTVLKLTHIVRKSHEGALKGDLPRVGSLSFAIQVAAERLVSDYETQYGQIIIAPSGLTCTDSPSTSEA
jgi:hypothetical protein